MKQAVSQICIRTRKNPAPAAQLFQYDLSGSCLLLKQIPENWASGQGKGLGRTSQPLKCAREEKFPQGRQIATGVVWNRRAERQAQDEVFSWNSGKILVPYSCKYGRTSERELFRKAMTRKISKHLSLQKELVIYTLSHKQSFFP